MCPGKKGVVKGDGGARPDDAVAPIQLAETDGNPSTVADPGWAPLILDPPYPDYVSGYNTVAASLLPRPNRAR